MTLLVCPDCGTDQVIVYEKHAVMANTYEHYCYSVKAHDDDAEARCLGCDWVGQRKDLGEQVMTKYEFEARQLISTWLAKEKIKPIGALRHVYPRCYVVDKAAARCLIVARPWEDSEEQVKDRTKKYPLDVIHTFDAGLDAGDWCATAYVCHAGVQETVAVGWKK